MACPILTTIQTIPREECLGNSLSRINDNFTNLKNQSCNNYSRLEDIDANILNLQTLYSNLSSVVMPGISKAWVKFDGARDTAGQVTDFLTDRFIYSSYNISTVYKKGTGDYRIFFQTPFTSSTYVAVGTSSETLSLGGQYTWLQPYTYATTFMDARIHSNTLTDRVDARHISIIFF